MGGKSVAERLKKEETRLDIDMIIDAAWDLVDRDGVDALSTRALAAELGVKGPALYWHVGSMQELRSLMIERALTESLEAPDRSDWDEWLASVGRRQRQQLLRHRDSGRIAASTPPTERMRNVVIPALMAPLLRAGFSRTEAFAAAGTLASFILGWVIYEQSEETAQFISSVVNRDQAFEFGLSTIITGLKVKAPQQARIAS